MKVTVIGCTHGRHRQFNLPATQVLVHTGDFSRRGDESDANDFLTWFESQPHEHKLFVCGNHDRISFTQPDTFARLLARCAPSCHYLHERAIEVAGLKWYGGNWTPLFNNWYWMSPRGPAMAAHWAKIPDDTQMLVTHGPPMGHLDLIMPAFGETRDFHQGCEELRDTIDTRLKSLKAHCFSHLHYEGNTTKVANGVTYVNAAVVDDGYSIRGKVQVIDIET